MQTEFAHEVFAVLAGSENTYPEPLCNFSGFSALRYQGQKLQFPSREGNWRRDTDIGFRLVAVQSIDRAGLACNTITILKIDNGCQ